MLVNGNHIRANIMTDYSTRETDTIYAGRYPVYDNEVSVSGRFADMIKKGIGDTVLVGEDKKPYIITGLTQGSGNGGLLKVQLTLDGILKIQPDFKQMTLQVYLNEGINAQEFLDEMQELSGDKIVGTADIDKGFEHGMGSYAFIIAIVGQVMIAVAGFVIILVLYFVISSSVIRRRRELGIQKAIGYTTVNLMNQISIGFLFPLIMGITVGCVLGAVSGNPIMSAALSGVGIMKANYIIEPVWVAATGVGMVILSYISGMLITWRIRNISAYALVTE
jgi:putative ABC transport system permease protein